MEVAGICGTDVRLYWEPPTNKPTIMGHENIGYIAKAGREFTRSARASRKATLSLSNTT